MAFITHKIGIVRTLTIIGPITGIAPTKAINPEKALAITPKTTTKTAIISASIWSIKPIKTAKMINVHINRSFQFCFINSFILLMAASFQFGYKPGALERKFGFYNSAGAPLLHPNSPFSL